MFSLNHHCLISYFLLSFVFTVFLQFSPLSLAKAQESQPLPAPELNNQAEQPQNKETPSLNPAEEVPAQDQNKMEVKDSAEETSKHEKMMRTLFQKLMVNKNPEERLRMMLALIENTNSSDVLFLAKTLKEGNDLDIQLCLLYALGRIGDRRAAQALRFEVENGKPEAKKVAITALGKLRDNWAIPTLVSIVEDRTADSDLKKRAVSALGSIASPKSVYALTSIPLTRDVPEDVKTALSWTIRKVQGQFPEEGIDNNIPPATSLSLNYKGMNYFFYHPAYRPEHERKRGVKPFLLVCIHDVDLKVQPLFDACYNFAKKRSLAVLVPFFDPMKFPEYATFNIHEERADLFLFKLVEHVTKIADLHTREIYFFGIGGGGDFVERFSLAHPQRLARAVIAGKRYPFFADANTFFPLGIKTSPFAPDLKLKWPWFVKSDILVLLSPKSDFTKFYQTMNSWGKASGLISRLVFLPTEGEQPQAMFDNHKSEIEEFLFRDTAILQKQESGQTKH